VTLHVVFRSSFAAFSWNNARKKRHSVMKAICRCCFTLIYRVAGLGEGRVRGSANSIKLEMRAEIAYGAYAVFVLCPNKCTYHLHLSSFPLYGLNNQHDFKWCGANRPIVFHDKTRLFTLTPCWKMFPAHLRSRLHQSAASVELCI